MRYLYFLGLLLCSSVITFAQTSLVNSNFEAGDATVWSTANVAATNQWFVGTATANGGTRAAYVTNDGGTTNTYDINVVSVNHLYTPVNFPAGEGAIILSFDWKGIGEVGATSWDYIRVSLTAAAPVAGTMPATADQLPLLYAGGKNYGKAYVVIPASMAGTTKNLVFTWLNDDNTGDVSVGAAIDNVVLTSATPTSLTGTKAIPGDFASIGAAIASLNAHGVGAGGVAFNVAAGSIFSETPLAVTATGTAANQIIFQKSGVGANPQITTGALGNFGATATATGGVTGSADAIIAIIGGDYITFDGIDIVATDVNATTNLIEFGYRIINASATDGAKNNTIKNSSITLNRTSTSVTGILQSSSSTGGGITATAASGANSDNKYYNITIQNSYFGINLNGGATTAANTDANNIIGTIGGGATIIGAAYIGTPTGDIGNGSTAPFGIQALNQTSVTIENTIVRNVTASTTTRGIFVSAAQGTSFIRNNKVFGLRNTSTTSTSSVNAFELTLATTGTHTINAYNNFATDVTSAYTGSASGTRQLKGMLLGSGSATGVYNIDHNSLRVDGSGSPTISSVALELGGTTATNNVRNNILANFTGAQTGTAKHYAIRSTSATLMGKAGSVSNYNDLYIDNTTNGFVGLTNTTDRATVADWTAALTGNAGSDANSINVNPEFVSALDLHISISSSSVNGLGTALAAVTTDIDGQTRLSPPDIGADEYSVVAGVNMGVTDLVNPLSTGCYTNAQTVTVSIKNFATSAHNFVTDPVTVTVNVTGAVTYSSNLIINTGTLAAGASMNATMPATIDMSAGGTYTFNASTSVTGDVSAVNDAMPATNRIVAPNVTLPQTNNFTGFTGSNLTTVFPNWREGSGATVPSGTTSSWTSQSLWGDGNVTARINLDVASDVEWLVGPKFVATANSLLKFDVAITDFADVIADQTGMTGTDDKVVVKISTDCGISFTDLYTFDASNTASITNSLVGQTIDLSSYAGQQVIIAFFGSEGTVSDAPDYDFHIDNINIYNTVPIDIGAVSLSTPLAPPTSVCYTASETVAITIRNYGTATLNFATTPVTVTTNVTGAATATLTGTLSTGTLAPGDDAVVTMSAPLNMTAAGTYTFNASTSIAGDGAAVNDAMVANTRTNAAVVTLPETVDFTGFTGSNLTANFANWREGSGAVYPTGTTSSWTSSTVFTSNGTTARINLASTTDEEWIVGPKFVATGLSRLKFKVAITDGSSASADPAGMVGTDDQIIVRISTDCGASYTDLYSFNSSTIGTISNTLEQQSISLNSFAGQTVMIAFFASEGTVDDAASYDFHIDDILIESPFAVDAGAIALAAPATKDCYSNAETVTVTIKNLGGGALDFSSTPLTVTTNVTGAATATLTGTVNTGTLAPDATLDVTMAGTLNMSAIGTYTFNASTAIAGDGDAANNAMTASTRTAVTVVAGTISVSPTSYCNTGGIPTVTLTGNAGGNIQWQESNSSSGPWTNVGTNSSTYIPGSAITATTYYQAVVSCGTSIATSNMVTVALQQPQILTTTPSSNCGTGTVTLQATANAGATVKWFANTTTNTVLHSGNSFTTPSISTSTTYYVSAVGDSLHETGGKQAPASTTNTTGNSWGLVFNVVNTPISLNSVKIYSVGSTAGSISVTLTDNTGATLATAGPFAYAAGSTTTPTVVTLPLEFSIPVGTGYRLLSSSMSGGAVIRESSGNTFPYNTASGNVTVTSGYISGTSTSYYWFYDWAVSTACGSSRQAITATIDPASNAGTLNGDQTICTADNPNNIVASGITGNVIRWESSADAAFTSPVTIANTTTTLSPGALTASTYYRVVVKSGSCSEAVSATPVLITVNNTITPSMSLAGIAGGSQACSNTDIAAGVNFFDNCNIIATVTPSGATPVSGSVNACVKVESAVPTAAGTNEPYVARHYNIIPATNAATATSTITLYFLQSEFDAFNTARGFYAALPTGTADNAGKANLRVSQFPGTATTPGTSGGVQLNPVDADITFADGRWAVSFAVTGSGSFFVHTGNFTLPVTLVNFRGEQSASINKLLWSTSTETNNRGFELERSSDGRNYSSITFVASKAENGNSTSTLNYNYNDARPLAGNNYYRLKQIDKDGKTTYSNVVLLSRKVSDITLSSVYPNPTTRELNLVITSPKSEKVTIVVTDLTGKVLMQRATQLMVGDNQELITVQQLAAGTYLIKAVCANGCETAIQRFVKH